MKGARMKTRTRVQGQKAELQDKESVRTMWEEKARIKVGNGGSGQGREDKYKVKDFLE